MTHPLPKLQVSQLIFSGQYIVGIQTAKLAKIISEQNYDFNELGIKESVITSYYLVLITEESLDILKRNLENLEETLRPQKPCTRPAWPSRPMWTRSGSP